MPLLENVNVNVQVVPCGPAVNESERKAFEQLKERLRLEPGHDEWASINELDFLRHAQTPVR